MSEVLYSVEHGVGRITINRPEQRNAVNSSVLQGMREALRDAGETRAVRVITITGSGDKVFCAGADLKAALSNDEGQGFGRGDFRQLLLEIYRCPKPTVALARGHVMAGGMGIFLACDLALACDDIHFSTPEIHVGMFPMMVLALLYRHVGRKKATEMLFLGERVPASEAMQLGIVNHLFPRNEFEGGAAAFVAKISEKSGAILRLGKEAIATAEDRSLGEALEYLESALGRVLITEDSKEGIRAFFEKRKPRWIDD
jgi:enoyl-CoA hydratase